MEQPPATSSLVSPQEATTRTESEYLQTLRMLAQQ